MDVLAYKEESTQTRSALHVRSLSYWAPANIGPYSQAVRVGERLFVAGQIGLIPASLSIPQPVSFAMEAALSLQHEHRIVKAVQEGTGGGFQPTIDSCICWLSGPPDTFQLKLQAVRVAWKKWLQALESQRDIEIPLLVVQVPGLPKGAQIEWQMVWRAERSAIEEDAEHEEAEHSPRTRTSLVVCDDVGKLALPETEGTAFSLRVFHSMGISADAGKLGVYRTSATVADD